MGLTYAAIELENTFQQRVLATRARVLGDEPLLGAVPMEMIDLVLHPATQALSVNPARPFRPTAHG